jgi:hypothetical protein
MAAVAEQPRRIGLLEKPVPICSDGMCEASASTGAPPRCASYVPCTRCVLPRAAAARAHGQPAGQLPLGPPRRTHPPPRRARVPTRCRRCAGSRPRPG